MEAKKLLTLIIDFTENSCDVTTKQIVDIVKGRSVKSVNIR